MYLPGERRGSVAAGGQPAAFGWQSLARQSDRRTYRRSAGLTRKRRRVQLMAPDHDAPQGSSRLRELHIWFRPATVTRTFRCCHQKRVARRSFRVPGKPRDANTAFVMRTRPYLTRPEWAGSAYLRRPGQQYAGRRLREAWWSGSVARGGEPAGLGPHARRHRGPGTCGCGQLVTEPQLLVRVSATAGLRTRSGHRARQRPLSPHLW